jgi:hypothetical protein
MEVKTMNTRILLLGAALLFFFGYDGVASGAEAYSSQTLFVIPWSKPAGKGTTSGGLRLLVPTQVSADFQPSIKGPQFFDVDLEGNVYVGTYGSQPPEVHKYSPGGNWIWTIRGAAERDFETVSLEQRRFAEIESMCCDNDGNVYIVEGYDPADDRIAKYDSNGQFSEFVRTGVPNPLRLKRDPAGGIAFLARRENDNDPRGGVVYPALWKENKTVRDPGAGKPKDANGRIYYGEFSEEYPLGAFPLPPGTKHVMKKMGKAIVLKRGTPVAKGALAPAGTDLETLIPYPFTLSGQNIIASDLKGSLYVDLYLNDPAVPEESRGRIVKVDPLSRLVLADIVRFPGEKTLNMINFDPVIVPETGDIYEFYDLRDGLHVVKFSIQR